VFLHRLALALHKTVAELETSMTARELYHWRLFDAGHEPLPDRLADIHFAMIATIMVNLMRSTETAPAEPADYFVIRDRTAPRGHADQVSEIDRLRTQWRGG
jgi:hypothetical protein